MNLHFFDKYLEMTLLKHAYDKNGSKGPAFLWQNFCQIHFGHQNCLKMYTRGCEWEKYQYDSFF